MFMSTMVCVYVYVYVGLCLCLVDSLLVILTKCMTL